MTHLSCEDTFQIKHYVEELSTYSKRGKMQNTLYREEEELQYTCIKKSGLMAAMKNLNAIHYLFRLG